MDIAYDHIQEEALDPETNKPSTSKAPAAASETQPNLNAELQDAFKAVQSSPWGAKLGGWFSQARKQGETFVQDLQKEATEAGEQATKGLGALVSRTRGMSLNVSAEGQVPGEEPLPVSEGEKEKGEVVAGAEKEGEERTENLPADIVKEAGSLVASLRSTAAAKLKDLQKAEDAADEALLRFGTNVRNFLRDAVTISAPDDEDKTEVLFETREPGSGKKVIHTTRLDAQLHAIHTNSGSFTDDPQGEEWKKWQEEFDAEKRTEAIATDLEKYQELRRAMEKLVPEKVEYGLFWMRYYFLRKAIEEEERRRKEVLKGASTEEEVAWDDDDEDENDKSSTPQPHHKASESTTTLNATAASANPDLLKPKEPRRSEDESKSVADSDASYDIVSGATSRATGSPKEAPKKADEDSDDDWE
ncbi:hypothetical protein M409DRAFT_29452 [Zasmidium cellare ATCC 36951]|uniref:BSD domain-containing protein n=1 Tax=Zasmidium cellare ATCC 36951 TaxID=1080233 RepID=A0A6A6BZC5_ZASCE|nr:uncharacterized protein M409DRAFT_29452 [Zasmidium cellare ATCC 36951]KAF2160157.1 hypothetical protein M409DRAFT_29452 [Zasmidium cellare ATCC 36951]